MKQEVKLWERKHTRQLADCRIFTVNESTEESPHTGEAHQFYYLNSPDWVNVAPITSANELVCVRQYRHGSEQITIEIPGGMVDPGENPKQAAVRECLEETGFEADELISLGVLAPNPAFLSNRLHTFVAPNARRVADILNTSTEHTEVQLIPLKQLSDFLISGEIDHALIAATLWRLLYSLKD